MTEVSRAAALTVRRTTAPPGARAERVEPDDPYVDTFWLPFLGALPLTTYRLLVRWSVPGAPPDLVLDQLAASLGLVGDDRLSIAHRAIEDLAAAGLATLTEDPPTVVVPATLPLLDPTRVDALPDHLHSLHGAWTAIHPGPAPERTRAGTGFLTLVTLADEALSDPLLSPLREVQRWRQAMRLSIDFHAEVLTALAPSEAATSLAELQDVSQALADAIWGVQGNLATSGRVSDRRLEALRHAAANVIDWIVDELPQAQGSPEA